MLNKLKKLILALASTVFAFINTPFIHAHCPVCTAAVGAGIAVSRFYGVDDTIVGLWIGAFIISTALWFNRLLKKEYIKFQGIAIAVIAFLLTVIPFYYAGLITDFEMVRSMPEHHSILGLGVLGLDKLLIGAIVGSIMTYLIFYISSAIKKTKGRVLFPYQTIVFTLLSLTILSSIAWLII